MRVFTIVIGAVLILAGAWSFAYPGQTFLGIAFIVGLVMILSGINAIADFFSQRRLSDGASLRLAEGIVTVIFGGLIMTELLWLEEVILMFFVAWIIFMGVLRATGSLSLLALKIKTWYAGLIMGIICIFVGIYGLTKITEAGMTMVLLIGLFLMLHGINVLIVGLQRKAVREVLKNE